MFGPHSTADNQWVFVEMIVLFLFFVFVEKAVCY